MGTAQRGDEFTDLYTQCPDGLLLARRTLGLPYTPFTAGMQKTYAWYREQVGP